jgi:hypothetical protein
MTISLTYTELKALKPCADRLKANAATFGPAKDRTASVTFQQLKDGGAMFGDLVWLADAMADDNPDCKRRLRLWSADCAARVLSIYEKHETSTAPRNAIIASRQFARGEINAAARAAASSAASVAARSAASDAAWAAASSAARDAASSAESYTAWTAAGCTASVAASSAASSAESYTAWTAAWAAEETWQFQHLVERMSDPEPEDWPLPALPVKQAAE